LGVLQPAAKELRGTLAASTLSGPNIFTDIAYDTSAASAQLGLRNAYVSSAGGAVFVVDYDRWGGQGWGKGGNCWGTRMGQVKGDGKSGQVT
jgi:hypothetical protein